MLFYEVDISMDCTEFKSHIVKLLLTIKFQVDIILIESYFFVKFFTFLQRFQYDITINNSNRLSIRV